VKLEREVDMSNRLSVFRNVPELRAYIGVIALKAQLAGRLSLDFAC
jgi:hypothetical protein